MAKFNLKSYILILTGLLIVATIGICALKPTMHKPLQINITEKFIKINTDGSVTTTTSVTTNSVKGK